MSLRATLILVALLVGVGLAWYLLRDSEAGVHAPNAPGEDPTPLLADEPIRLNRLTRIEIARPNQETIVLQQHRGRWQMAQPAVFAVDTSKVANLLAILDALAVLPSDSPVSEPSVALAEVSLSDGEYDLRFAFGHRIGRGIGPVAVDDGAYVLTDDLAHEILERLEPTDLFSQSLQTPSAFECRAVVLDSELGKVELHQEAGRWYIGEGTTQRALSIPIDGYIDIPALLNIPRHSGAKVAFSAPYPPASLAAYGLDQPRLTVTYTHAASHPDAAPAVTALTIGGPDLGGQQAWFGTYAPPDDPAPVVFSIPAEFSITMARGIDSFRDPRIVETLPLDVESIALDFGSHRCLSDGVSFTVSPEDALGLPPLSPALRLRQLASVLSEATAVGYQDDSAITGQAPLATIEVTPRFGGAVERLAVYPFDLESFQQGVRVSIHNASRRAAAGFSGDLRGSPRGTSFRHTPTVLVAREGEAAVLRVPRDKLEAVLTMSGATSEIADE